VGLDYATYLGTHTTPANLATTDVPPSDLPLSGDVARESIPFGSTTLTLVAAGDGQLGGPLGYRLSWIFLFFGLALTGTIAFSVEELVRRRRAAELDAVTIATLYGQLDDSFVEQRSIAETLQRSLLPQRNPQIAELEIASRYIAGADGVDIGGDWYSMISLDDRHFGFVVGDVSGRGISAATVMARMRFTIRAYLIEGHDPATVLDLCAPQIDLADDGHFATVLVGIGNVETREIVLASAGHFSPLLIEPDGVRFADLDVGLPLGATETRYRQQAIRVLPGSTLIAFTDGLVERRGENLDLSLDRLSQSTKGQEGSIEELVDAVLAAMSEGQVEDDIALLAFRWRTPR
jgi:serine phosphatase RsbU (regulator of sigma subunit)